jgi:predicted TIM-barrel fold metal-dependent hydrolase
MAQIYQMVKRFSENKIILAHWGGGILFYHILKKEVRAVLKNVYYDTAASPFLYDTEVYPLAVRLAGLEKILFGSDYPLIPPSRYKKEFELAGLAQHEINSISGLNAAKLLNL